MRTPFKLLGAGPAGAVAVAFLFALAPEYCAGAQTPVLKTIYSFTGQDGDGAVPLSGVIIGRNHQLFGTTSSGGAAGAGTVFELQPPAEPGGAWIETTIYSFPSGSGYPSGLTLGPDGALYGATTPQGQVDVVPDHRHGSGNGSVFQLTPPGIPGGPWTETTMYTFMRPEYGVAPMGALVFGGDGALYGAAWEGGTGSCLGVRGNDVGCGAIFRLARRADGTWAESTVYSFYGLSAEPYDGANPQGLALGPNGVFYGVTVNGGAFSSGTAVSFTPPSSAGGEWTETVIHSFANTHNDGGNPDSAPVVDTEGRVYGSTYVIGGDLTGSAFRLTPPADGGDWKSDTLFIFDGGGAGTGLTPNGLTLGPDGALFGTSLLGGVGENCCGVVFELTPADGQRTWPETVLHDFTGQNGDGATPYPYSVLAVDPGGATYGTTSAGGSAGAGVVFEIDR